MDKYEEFLNSDDPKSAPVTPPKKDKYDEFLNSDGGKQKSPMGESIYRAASDALLPGMGAGARVLSLPKDQRKDALETTGMALGSMAGTSMGAITSPVTGPVGPIVGSVAGGAGGSATGTALEKGLEAIENRKMPSVSKQDFVDIGKSAERGGLYTALGEGASVGLKVGFRGAAKLAEKMTPSLYNALAKIPPNATRLAMKYRDVLEDKSMGTADSIDRAVQWVMKVFKNSSSEFIKSNEDTALVSKKIIEGEYGNLRGALELKNMDAKKNVEQVKKELGVYSEFSEAEKKILKSSEQKRGQAGGKVPSKDQVGSLIETIHGKFSSGQLNRNQALKSLDSLDNVAEGYNKQLISEMRDIVSGPPADPGKSNVDKKFFNRLVDLYHTPGEIPRTESAGHVKNVTRIINYVDQNADKMGPADAGYALLGAKRALHTMENWARDSKDEFTSNFIKYQYGKLNEVMRRLPGFQKLLDAQESASMAMTMRDTLDKVMQKPDDLHSFLKDTFEGVGNPKSQSILTHLQALEEETHKPIIDNLMEEYEIRKNALDAKFPFQKEFSSPADAQGFLEGLFKLRGLNSSDGAKAEQTLQQIESYPGMKSVVLNMEKNFAAREFQPIIGHLSPWEKKLVLLSPPATVLAALTTGKPNILGGMSALGATYGVAKSPAALGGAIKAGRAASKYVPPLVKRGLPVAASLFMGDGSR